MFELGKLMAFVAARLLFVAAVGALLGLMSGQVVIGILVAMAVALVWQWIELFRLAFWLRNRRTANPPETFGLWSEVGAAIVRLHRRKRFHKARMLAATVDACAFVYDGYIRVAGVRLDAAYCRVSRRGADDGLRLAQPYALADRGGTPLGAPHLLETVESWLP